MNYRTIKIFQHIQEDSTLLNLEEKLIMNYIWGWQVQDKCCFASDEFLSGMIACTELKTRGLINGLANRGRIKIHTAPGSNTRMLSIHVQGQEDPCTKEIDIFGDYDV